jgi:antitoxin component of MazEF toxin-antitoxin module
MRVRIQRTSVGEGSFPLPDSVMEQMGVKPGDVLVVHVIHGGTMLAIRPWGKAQKEVTT